ncbi:MAG: cytochrome c [Gammaproteobacteria bacterium]|jgi:mono/diheme cytochrome c family protein
MLTNFRHGLVVLLVPLFLSGPAAYGQQKTVKDGIFTAEQVAAGQVVYDESCGTCHDMKFYADIWEYWQDKPLLDFWFTIVAEMPAENPGVLRDSEYTDIVAYILSNRGYPSGDTPLDRNNGMDSISIVAP